MAGFPLQQLQVVVQYKGRLCFWYRRVHCLVTKRYGSAGKGGWRDAGNLASLAGSFVSGGLGGVNLRDGNGIKLSGKVFNVEGISAMNGLAGGLASTVVNFGMTGNATFNLASIKGVGLLEVTIGKDGISSRLGSGGMSLSSETLMLAASGHQETGKVMDWKYGTDESRSTLNGINQLGYTNIQVNHDLANDIWNEQIGVDYADIAGYGLYKVGEKSITLNSDLLGGGLEESAKLATVLSHEGTHLYGNRIEGIAHFHGATTYMQLLDQFKLAGDETFAGEIMAGLTDPSSWVENTGDEDWWKLMDDGSIAYDGQADLYDVNGNLIYKTQSRGLEGSLVEILYGKNATPEEVEKVRDLLESSFDHTTKSDDLTDRNQWYWNVDSNHGKVIDVSKYEDIYNSRVLVDSITGQTDTIRNLNPRTIYDKMVANGTMDRKSGDSMRARLARMELRVETDSAAVESLKFYENVDGGYISYEEFKANNFITGGMPVLSIRNTFVNREITTFTGATGNLSVNPHRGVDGGVEKGIDSLPLFQNDTSKVVYASKGDLDDSNYQGRHVSVQTDITYTFKGNRIVDEVIYRTLHLSNVDVVDGQSVSFNTVLGQTGNSGKWGDSGYGNHSHEDIYTVRPSPYLNFLSDVAYTNALENYSPIKESESYGTYKDLYKGNEYNYIFHDNKYYYDKFIFADITQYKKRDTAHSYNKGE